MQILRHPLVFGFYPRPLPVAAPQIATFKTVRATFTLYFACWHTCPPCHFDCTLFVLTFTLYFQTHTSFGAALRMGCAWLVSVARKDKFPFTGALNKDIKIKYNIKSSNSYDFHSKSKHSQNYNMTSKTKSSE